MGNEPKDMMDAVARSVAGRTGRTGDEWVALVPDQGPDHLDQRAVRAWLAEHHGLPQSSRSTVATAAAETTGWTMPAPDHFADQLHDGTSSRLRPLHEAVLAPATDQGTAVAVQGRASCIPVVRSSTLEPLARTACEQN